MLNDPSWLPLFPLKTVLFPRGVLPLRVFEARYIDMVRECMKSGQPFGVTLIKSGQEVGMAAEPEPIGSLAHITHWDMQEAGVLLLRTQGGQRFRILETRVLPDQRLEAQIELLPADTDGPLDDMHVQCATALKAVTDNVLAKLRSEHGEDFDDPFSQPMAFDSTGWVANRWCELLPIPLKARQKLLELDDARMRLNIIHQYLKQHKIA
jgi:Lon protease-like protein